jgi:ketosteroid isomerase-like protein
MTSVVPLKCPYRAVFWRRDTNRGTNYDHHTQLASFIRASSRSMSVRRSFANHRQRPSSLLTLGTRINMFLPKGACHMRQIFAVAVLAFSAAAIASGQDQGTVTDPRSTVEQVIRKLDNERVQAQIHADVAALERIYADDFIGVGPSGTVRAKPQVISDFTSGDLRFQSITTRDVRVRVYGNAAVETGLSTMDGQDKGKAVPHDTRFTRVWVKQHGRWRLVANHYSSIVSH